MTNNDGKHKYNNSPQQVVGCMFASYSETERRESNRESNPHCCLLLICDQ